MTDQSYDARGLLCPLPVLRARKLLRDMPPGAVLTITCDDAIAIVDLPNFCREAGHDLLGMTEDNGAQTYKIRRGSD